MDDSFEMIKSMKQSIEAAKSELEDPDKTSFIIVMIAEEMAIYETERLLSSLITYNIPVHHIVVEQSGGVNEFDDSGDVDVPVALVTERAGCQKHQEWAEAFATAANDVVSDLVDQDDV